jgi:hypothetical protein
MTRSLANRSVNSSPTDATCAAAGADGSGPAALLEFRLELLEGAYRELGARLAALEGIVFALQHRLRELEGQGELEGQLPPVAPPHRLDPASQGVIPPHRSAKPK